MADIFKIYGAAAVAEALLVCHDRKFALTIILQYAAGEFIVNIDIKKHRHCAKCTFGILSMYEPAAAGCPDV